MGKHKTENIRGSSKHRIAHRHMGASSKSARPSASMYIETNKARIGAPEPMSIGFVNTSMSEAVSLFSQVSIGITSATNFAVHEPLVWGASWQRPFFYFYTWLRIACHRFSHASRPVAKILSSALLSKTSINNYEQFGVNPHESSTNDILTWEQIVIGSRSQLAWWKFQR